MYIFKFMLWLWVLLHLGLCWEHGLLIHSLSQETWACSNQTWYQIARNWLFHTMFLTVPISLNSRSMNIWQITRWICSISVSSISYWAWTLALIHDISIFLTIIPLIQDKLPPTVASYSCKHNHRPHSWHSSLGYSVTFQHQLLCW